MDLSNNGSQQTGVPFMPQNPRNLQDFLNYIDQVLPVYNRVRETGFHSQQVDLRDNQRMSPYHANDDARRRNLINSQSVVQQMQNATDDARVSQRAQSAQIINEICRRDAANYALATIGRSVDGPLPSNNVQQIRSGTEAITQSISQNTQLNSSTQSIFQNQSLGYNSIPQASLFSNPTPTPITTFGYQPELGNTVPVPPTQLTSTLGYQPNTGSTSIFGSPKKEASVTPVTQGFAQSLGYQSQVTTTLFGNPIKETPAFESTQIQEKPPIFSNQTPNPPSTIGYQSETQKFKPLLNKKHEEPSKTQSNNQPEATKTQNTPLLGYSNLTTGSSEAGLKLFSNPKPQQSPKVVTEIGLTSIHEEKSQSSEAKPIGNSVSQPSGGLFGQTNSQVASGGLFSSGSTSAQSGGLFASQSNPSSGLFGQNNPKPSGGIFGITNSSSVSGGLFGQPSTSTPAGGLFGSSKPPSFSNQQAETVKPSSLGYQSEQKKEEKKEVPESRPYRAEEKTVPQEVKQPVQQNSLFSSQGETIFTQKPKPNNIFNNNQGAHDEKKVDAVNQPVNTLKEPQKLAQVNPIPVVLPTVPTSSAEQPKPANIFTNPQPISQPNSQPTGIIFNNPPSNSTPIPIRTLTPNLNPPTTTSSLFNGLPATNIFAQKPPAVGSGNLFAGGLNPTQNMFSSQSQSQSQGSSLFGGPSRGGASLFANTNAQKKNDDENSDNEGEGSGDEDDENAEQSKEEEVEGEIKYSDYAQTEVIFKLQKQAQKFKVLPKDPKASSSSILRENLILSFEKFEGNETVYLIVRMATKTPIYFGVLIQKSAVTIGKSEKDKIVFTISNLIQIDLEKNKKKSMEHWRIQLAENQNSRDFIAKCEEIIKNLKQGSN